MVLDHLDAVWRAALAASGDRTVAEDVTTDLAERAGIALDQQTRSDEGGEGQRQG